jgi:hypothetical protein
MDDLVKCGDVLVEGCEVNITSFSAIPIGVQGIGAAIFSVYEQAKVLRPVSERRISVNIAVRPSNVVRDSKTLEKLAVGCVVGMPPHLTEIS